MKLDLVGERYGRLIVLEESKPYITPSTGKRNKCYLCQCDCGGRTIAPIGRLRSGNVKSCGCLWKENQIKIHTKHGHSKRHKNSRTYRIWCNMKNRCNCLSTPDYQYYGGRGIQVCERWIKFENFLVDMGECPDGMMIDRINNDGNYEPNNCRWASPKEQNRNHRRNIWIEYQGRKMIMQDWASELKMHPATLARRLKYWPIEKVFAQPVNENLNRHGRKTT